MKILWTLQAMQRFASEWPITYCIALGLTLFSPNLVHPVWRRVSVNSTSKKSRCISFLFFSKSKYFSNIQIRNTLKINKHMPEMKYPIPFPTTIKCRATNIIPININAIPYNTFIHCMLAMKVLSLVIYYNGKPLFAKRE